MNGETMKFDASVFSFEGMGSKLTLKWFRLKV